MAVIGLINWTIERAQHLRTAQHEPSDSDSGPSRGWLLSVLEPDPVLPTKPEDHQVARVASSASIPIAPEVMVARPSSEVVVPLPNEVPDLAAVAPVAASTSPVANEEQESALTKPGISTAMIDRDRGIALRWVLRDIKSNRLQLSPVSPDDLRTLIELGLVEMCEDTPVLTKAGTTVIV